MVLKILGFLFGVISFCCALVWFRLSNIEEPSWKGISLGRWALGCVVFAGLATGAYYGAEALG